MSDKDPNVVEPVSAVTVPVVPMKVMVGSIISAAKRSR